VPSRAFSGRSTTFKKLPFGRRRGDRLCGTRVTDKDAPGQRYGIDFLDVGTLGTCLDDTLEERNVTAPRWNAQPEPARQLMFYDGR
jgi:hypothetical protein